MTSHVSRLCKDFHEGDRDVFRVELVTCEVCLAGLREISRRRAAEAREIERIAAEGTCDPDFISGVDIAPACLWAWPCDTIEISLPACALGRAHVIETGQKGHFVP